MALGARKKYRVVWCNGTHCTTSRAAAVRLAKRHGRRGCTANVWRMRTSVFAPGGEAGVVLLRCKEGRCTKTGWR